MNGHDRRRQRIIGRIEKTALELFTNDGGDQVSMDEIAARANVSKVTIYKYFHSKEELRREVIYRYADEALTAIEKVLDSDMDFLEKLKIALLAQVNSPRVADYQALSEILEKENQAADGGRSLVRRIGEIMHRFYAQGKQEGYVDESLSFELLSLYTGIFQAGFQARSRELQQVLADPTTRQQLLDVFFFGMIRKKQGS